MQGEVPESVLASEPVDLGVHCSAKGLGSVLGDFRNADTQTKKVQESGLLRQSVNGSGAGIFTVDYCVQGFNEGVDSGFERFLEMYIPHPLRPFAFRQAPERIGECPGGAMGVQERKGLENG